MTARPRIPSADRACERPAMSEGTLQKLVLAHLNATPGVLAWRQNTGTARSASGRVVRFGVPGQADITGLLGPRGRRLEVELKSSAGRPTPDQLAYGERITALGGLYIVARTLDEAMGPVLAALEDA